MFISSWFGLTCSCLAFFSAKPWLMLPGFAGLAWSLDQKRRISGAALFKRVSMEETESAVGRELALECKFYDLRGSDEICIKQGQMGSVIIELVSRLGTFKQTIPLPPHFGLRPDAVSTDRRDATLRVTLSESFPTEVTLRRKRRNPVEPRVHGAITSASVADSEDSTLADEFLVVDSSPRNE